MRSISCPRAVRLTVVATMSATIGVTGMLPAYADLSASSARTWGTNGRVSAMVTVGGMVVVGGDFTAVVDTAGRWVPAANLARFDPSTGAFDPSWRPVTDGPVTALTTSGSSLYIGGVFTLVNGQSRRNLAAVNVSSSGILPWAPRTSGGVSALSVAFGSVLIGGRFDKVIDSSGSNSAAYLARVSVDSATLTTAGVPAPDGAVSALVLSPDGKDLYAGGEFDKSGSTATKRIARLRQVGSGLMVDPTFKAGVTNGSTRPPVVALALSQTQLLVAAGGGGGGCAGLSLADGATQWGKRSNGDMQAVALVGATVYCAGHFGGTKGFDDLPRYKIAAVNPATGATLAYAPRVDSPLGVWTLLARGRSLLVGGDFLNYGKTQQPHLAMVVDEADVTGPSRVDGVVALPASHSIELSWAVPSTDGGSPIKNYAVERTSGSITKMVAGRLKTPQFVDTAVQVGRSYTYRVTAVNAAGSSPLSAPVTASPDNSGPTPPLAPNDVSAFPGRLEVDVLWSPPASTGGSVLTAYRLYRSVDGRRFTLLSTLDSNSNTYRDTDVTGGDALAYRVTAVNAAGEGPPTTTSTVTVTGGVPSAPPFRAKVVPDGVELTWDPPADDGGSPVTKYAIVRDKIRIVSLRTPASSFVDSGLIHDRSFTYQLRAQNTNGNSPLSSVTIYYP